MAIAPRYLSDQLYLASVISHLLCNFMTNQAYDLNFAAIGSDVTIWAGAKIISPEVISIGNSVIVDDFVFIMGGKRTAIGSFVHIASFTSITGGGEFDMADFATLSSGIRVLTGTDDFVGGSMTNSTLPLPFRIPTRSFVRLEKHAIVGANSVILPGIVIGEGASIGANSLVTKDCEPWTIYYGSPAKARRTRPKDKILELETQFRQIAYDAAGKYIPREAWRMI